MTVVGIREPGRLRHATFGRRCRAAIVIAGCIAGVRSSVARATETFDTLTAGPFTALDSAVGRWTAVTGRAEVHSGRARAGRPHDGNQALRLVGGADGTVDLALPRPVSDPALLVLRAERWTRDKPFVFTIEAAGADGMFRPVHDGAGVGAGGPPVPVVARLPPGIARVRFRTTTPPDRGVLLDDVQIVAAGPMRLDGIDVVQPVVPTLVRKPVNPILGMRVRTGGDREPLVLEGVTVSLAGTTKVSDIAEVTIFRGTHDPTGPFGDRFGATEPGEPAAPLMIRGARPLLPGDDWFWVSVRLKDSADIDGRIDAAVKGVRISGRDVAVTAGDPPGAQRIGVVLRSRGEDGSDTYRIPGLVRTSAGSLVAAYDARYRGAPDLPADIDVGTSRSTDGGRTWEPMRIALDMGRDPAFAFDGVGDPCVFVDAGTGRIHVAAVWSHGRRAWKGSGPGLEPAETGQLVMAWSDDDGRTWSASRNLTAELKDPAWRFLLAGPGTGITTRDGTLVFPVQFKDAADVPHATVAWSKDHGASWHIGAGAAAGTTESQVVELADGSLMLNCRGDRRARVVALTRDLGRTWTPHAGDAGALPESGCMASLLALDVPAAGRRLFFSNPATTTGRHSMTVKVSADEGLTWPEAGHTLYDRRHGYGYACLAPVDDAHLGVLEEGLGELYFLRLPIAELLDGPDAPRR